MMIRERDGLELTLHQACNDWFSVDTPDGKALIVNPTTVALTQAEHDQLAQLDADGQLGTMFEEFEWVDLVGPTYRLRRRRRPRKARRCRPSTTVDTSATPAPSADAVTNE